MALGAAATPAPGNATYSGSHGRTRSRNKLLKLLMTDQKLCRWFPAFLVCATHLPEAQHDAIRDALQACDSDNKGCIPVSDLCKTLVSLGISVSAPMYEEAVEAAMAVVDEPETWSELLGHLSRQKEELSMLRAEDDSSVTKTRNGRHGMRRKLAATDSLIHAKSNSRSMPSLVPSNTVGQISLAHRNSAQYSFGPGFGEPHHAKGKHNAVESCRPGVGQYEIPQTIGSPVKGLAGGATGGWFAGSHDVFMRVLARFEFEATPQFFDDVSALLPDKSRADITEHVRWYADYNVHKLEQDHHVQRIREEALGNTVEVSERQLRIDMRQMRRKARALHQQAVAEEATDGFQRSPVHRQAGDVEVNGNGHPAFRKARGHAFGRDRRHANEGTEAVKLNTPYSHVRFSSHFDVPGPGNYCQAQDEGARLLPRTTGGILGQRRGGSGAGF